MPTSDREQRIFPSLVSSDARPSDSRAYIRLAHVAVEALFQGKWQVQILCAMRGGSVRIGQLGRLIPGASKKVLTQSLRRLESQGIVVRRDLSDLVLHVEYELHQEVRESIGELLDHISLWGADFVALQGKKGQLNGGR
jgi:DNA-binding HxlR family transcriptional regulator